MNKKLFIISFLLILLIIALNSIAESNFKPDLSGDSSIDLEDLAILGEHCTITTSAEGSCCSLTSMEYKEIYDMDNNNIVDKTDCDIMFSLFGRNCATDPILCDSDNDGVFALFAEDNTIIKQDICPNTPESERDDVIIDSSSDWWGCSPSERDQDGDKVMDIIDDCPLVPGVKENNGCPIGEQEARRLYDDLTINEGEIVYSTQLKQPDANGYIIYENIEIYGRLEVMSTPFYLIATNNFFLEGVINGNGGPDEDGKDITIDSGYFEVAGTPVKVLESISCGEQQQCLDTDGGNNIYIKGITKGNLLSGDYIEFEDSCSFGYTELTRDIMGVEEGQCGNAQPGSQNFDEIGLSEGTNIVAGPNWFECPNDCSDGACVPNYPLTKPYYFTVDDTSPITDVILLFDIINNFILQDEYSTSLLNSEVTKNRLHEKLTVFIKSGEVLIIIGNQISTEDVVFAYQIEEYLKQEKGITPVVKLSSDILDDDLKLAIQ